MSKSPPLTSAEIGAARKNYRAFKTREPRRAASMEEKIEGRGRLGDDPAFVRHFAKTSAAPSQDSLFAALLYGPEKGD